MAENSLSWTPLSLGFYHDLKASLMIFQYFYLPITQRKPILFRKEDCLLGCMIQTKAKQEQERLDRHILFLKKTFVLATVLRTVKVIAVGPYHMGL